MGGDFATRCPRCNNATVTVADSRSYDGQRRRRYCKTCKHRWSTVEVSADMAERFEGALDRVDRAIASLIELRRQLLGAKLVREVETVDEESAPFFDA